MITYDDYATLLHYRGNHLGEVRKNQSDMLMNATFRGDVGYRHVYILDPKEGWHYTDAKFSKHSNPSLAKDAVDSYLQFRPKEHHPVGTYVFIPDDTSYRMNIDEDDPLNGDTSCLWMIVAKNDSKQFVRYLVIRCNWRFKWVVGYGDQKKIYDCWGALRSANSYTSGIWHDYRVYALDNLTGSWVPDTHYIFGDELTNYGLWDTRTIDIQVRMMLTENDINPSCYMVSKVMDVYPKGVIKLSLKQDDFDPKRDNVELRVCNYYDYTGDINVIEPIPTPEPDPTKTSTISSLVVNSDGELEGSDTLITTLDIGKTYYYNVSFSDDGVVAQWRITYSDETDPDRLTFERLMTLRNVSDTIVSLRPSKSSKLPGKQFKLTVCDVDGNYENNIAVEVN